MGTRGPPRRSRERTQACPEWCSGPEVGHGVRVRLHGRAAAGARLEALLDRLRTWAQAGAVSTGAECKAKDLQEDL